MRSEEVSVETYEKNLENLKQVSYSDVTNMLTEDGGDHILYVGRQPAIIVVKILQF